MKLSEMNTEQLAACLCRIAAPVERIGKDAHISAFFKENAGKTDTTVIELVSASIGALTPVLLGDHLADVMAILSALTDKTQAELRAQKGVQTVRDIRAVIDQDLMDFFKSSAGMDVAT